MLCLQTYGSSLIVGNAFFALYASIQEVAGVYLYAGFIGIYFQCNAALGGSQSGSRFCNISIGVQYPVVIIAITVFELNKIIFSDVLTDCFRSDKIHRSILHRNYLSGSHESAVYRGIIICVHI